MSYKFTKTLTKVVFGIALACYIAAAYIMNRGGNAVAMLAVASAVLVIGVVIRLCSATRFLRNSDRIIEKK